MVYHVFNHEMEDEVEEVKSKNYERDVWGFVHDVVLAYHEKYPLMYDLHYECGKCGEFGDLNDMDLCKDCFKEEEEEVASNSSSSSDNDYCPDCNVLTNTKTCAMSRTCCKCRVITFCEGCGSDRDECPDKECWHDWETHWICDGCKK
jgi:hypothetical protein